MLIRHGVSCRHLYQRSNLQLSTRLTLASSSRLCRTWAHSTPRPLSNHHIRRRTYCKASQSNQSESNQSDELTRINAVIRIDEGDTIESLATESGFSQATLQAALGDKDELVPGNTLEFAADVPEGMRVVQNGETFRLEPADSASVDAQVKTGPKREDLEGMKQEKHEAVAGDFKQRILNTGRYVGTAAGQIMLVALAATVAWNALRLNPTAERAALQAAERLRNQGRSADGSRESGSRLENPRVRAEMERRHGRSFLDHLDAEAIADEAEEVYQQQLQLRQAATASSASTSNAPYASDAVLRDKALRQQAATARSRFASNAARAQNGLQHNSAADKQQQQPPQQQQQQQQQESTSLIGDASAVLIESQHKLAGFLSNVLRVLPKLEQPTSTSAAPSVQSQQHEPEAESLKGSDSPSQQHSQLPGQHSQPGKSMAPAASASSAAPAAPAPSTAAASSGATDAEASTSGRDSSEEAAASDLTHHPSPVSSQSASSRSKTTHADLHTSSSQHQVTSDSPQLHTDRPGRLDPGSGMRTSSTDIEDESKGVSLPRPQPQQVPDSRTQQPQMAPMQAHGSSLSSLQPLQAAEGNLRPAPELHWVDREVVFFATNADGDPMNFHVEGQPEENEASLLVFEDLEDLEVLFGKLGTGLGEELKWVVAGPVSLMQQCEASDRPVAWYQKGALAGTRGIEDELEWMVELSCLAKVTAPSQMSNILAARPELVAREDERRRRLSSEGSEPRPPEENDLEPEPMVTSASAIELMQQAMPQAARAAMDATAAAVASERGGKGNNADQPSSSTDRGRAEGIRAGGNGTGPIRLNGNSPSTSMPAPGHSSRAGANGNGLLSASKALHADVSASAPAHNRNGASSHASPNGNGATSQASPHGSRAAADIGADRHTITANGHGNGSSRDVTLNGNRNGSKQDDAMPQVNRQTPAEPHFTASGSVPDGARASAPYEAKESAPGRKPLQTAPPRNGAQKQGSQGRRADSSNGATSSDARTNAYAAMKRRQIVPLTEDVVKQLNQSAVPKSNVKVPYQSAQPVSMLRSSTNAADNRQPAVASASATRVVDRPQVATATGPGNESRLSPSGTATNSSSTFEAQPAPPQTPLRQGPGVPPSVGSATPSSSASQPADTTADSSWPSARGATSSAESESNAKEQSAAESGHDGDQQFGDEYESGDDYDNSEDGPMVEDYSEVERMEALLEEMREINASYKKPPSDDWLKLKYVCIPEIHYPDGVVGLMTTNMASDESQQDPHVLAFESRQDAEAAQGLLQTLQANQAGARVCVKPMAPAQLQQQVAETGHSVTVYAPGQLGMKPGMSMEELARAIALA